MYLNSALAMENAALERVQTRVQQTILEEAKPLFQHHALESTRNIIDKSRGSAEEELMQ